MQKIVPFLWFDGKAEEAEKFYTSIFKNSTVTHDREKSQRVMSALMQMTKIDIKQLEDA